MTDRNHPLWHALRATLDTLVLATVFFAILTPVALLRRLFRPDPLHQKPAPRAHSYWSPHRDRTPPPS